MDKLLLLQTPAQLSQHVKALRKGRKLTQVELASYLGITQSRLALIEKYPEKISVAQLLDLFALLGVEVLLRPKSPKSARALGKGEDW